MATDLNLDPNARLEHFLGRIAGDEEAKELEPKTRIEHFLGLIGGNEMAKELEPKTRIEFFLYKIAKSRGGGAGNAAPTETIK